MNNHMDNTHFTRHAPGTHSGGMLAQMTLLESIKRKDVRIFTARQNEIEITALAEQLRSDYEPPYIFGRNGIVTNKTKPDPLGDALSMNGAEKSRKFFSSGAASV